VRAVRPRGATAPARSGEIDAKHAQLLSAFAAAAQSGDLNALTQLLASDVRVVTDGGGKVRAAQVVIDGADRVARFLVDATRKRPGAWWRDDFTRRFAIINGLPRVIVDGSEGPVQTAAFERGRRYPSAVRGAQPGQVAAFGTNEGRSSRMIRSAAHVDRCRRRF
jgi:RNA polymerase sigma-70 factor (ECF subfamily)